MATVDAGDEVLTAWPSFPSYVLDPLKLGGVPVQVIVEDDGFKPGQGKQIAEMNAWRGAWYVTRLR